MSPITTFSLTDFQTSVSMTFLCILVAMARGQLAGFVSDDAFDTDNLVIIPNRQRSIQSASFGFDDVSSGYRNAIGNVYIDAVPLLPNYRALGSGSRLSYRGYQTRRRLSLRPRRRRHGLIIINAKSGRGYY